MPYLSEVDGQNLLVLARKAIVEAVSRRELPETIPKEGIFGQRRGVFVTLHVRGELRGCIGTTEGDEPLGEATVRCAVSAALHDPRFPAMRSEELEGLHIEISVLSPLTPMRPEEIEIGRHGLVVSDENHRGLLLPQVAPEHGLNREQFLAETCRKARLPQDAWRWTSTRIQGFTCEVFSDAKRAWAN
ncbi:MAG TPA: AmmeMemoRadiSam system protein A [Methylomirabilota bacterium]|jgi:AmmeMemoRadiSam system protein A|nr:AmmeMemoRadiSam system protein A [Methylomirabilota bacterium]